MKVLYHIHRRKIIPGEEFFITDLINLNRLTNDRPFFVSQWSNEWLKNLEVGFSYYVLQVIMRQGTPEITLDPNSYFSLFFLDGIKDQFRFTEEIHNLRDSGYGLVMKHHVPGTEQECLIIDAREHIYEIRVLDIITPGK